MRASLVITVAMILIMGTPSFTIGMTEECLQVRREIQQAGKSYENIVSVWETHRPAGEARCEDFQGQWFCFQCLESNKMKLIHLLLKPNGKVEMRGYGCPCKKDD